VGKLIKKTTNTDAQNLTKKQKTNKKIKKKKRRKRKGRPLTIT